MARGAPAVVAEGYPERLRKAAAAVTDARDAYQLALAQRDELVVAAVDLEGMSQGAVAELVGVRKGRISAILAGSQPEVGAE